MKALLITAHGSRKQTSNSEILDLVDAVGKMPENGFDIIMGAFIQYATPLFSEQVDVLVDRGASQIVVFPYFIAAGSHVLTDIPGLIEQARTKYPHIDFKLIPHIGGLKGIKTFIVNEISAYLSTP
jgi:sirohydrochlorin ferrochelatase